MLVAAAVLLIPALRRRRPWADSTTNYRAFFVMGIAFIPTGAAMMVVFAAAGLPFVIGLPLFAIGLTYTAIGLANRDDW